MLLEIFNIKNLILLSKVCCVHSYNNPLNYRTFKWRWRDSNSRLAYLHQSILTAQVLKTILVIIKSYQSFVLHLSVPKQVLLDFLDYNSQRSIIHIYKYVVYYFVVLLCFLSPMQLKPNIPIISSFRSYLGLSFTYTISFNRLVQFG